MVDLQRLRLFVQVAESGSLTKAALVLGMVQPVLSRHVANLELDVGGRLFKRTGRGVELSELGEMLMPRVRALLFEADSLMADAKAATGTVSGEVRIGMLASFAGTLGVELLTRSAEEFPQVRIKIFEGTIGRIDEWLDDGRIDIAVNFRDSQIALGDEQKLGTVDTYLVGAPDHPLLANDTVEFRRLENLPLILSATPSGLRIMLDNLAVRHGIELNAAFEVDSVALHLELARRGLGFAVMTPQAILMKLRESNLGFARIVRPSIFRHIALGTSVKRGPSVAVRKTVGLIAAIGNDLVNSGIWGDLPEDHGAATESAEALG